MDKKCARVTVIGSYAVGMTVSCGRFPREGETVKGHGFQALHGGKGSNQAIAVARLGGTSVFGSCIGNDSFGKEARNMLVAEHINIDHLKVTDAASTGVGLIFVAESGSNEIVIDLGANELLTPADIDRAEKDIAASDLLLVQLEVSREAVIRAIETAHGHGVRTILNPAPFQALPDEVVRKTSFITPNETEAAAMLGLPADSNLEGKELAGRLFSKFGVGVIVTLGSKGVYVRTADVDAAVPTIKVKVVDTTGAGDTFSGALAVGLGENMDILDAVRFANCAASMSVTVEGVVPSIPYRKDVDALMARADR